MNPQAQTPLFVSLVNQHWECARILLEAGADPNGSQANLCSPLSIMCQRGFYPGIKVASQTYKHFQSYINYSYSCCASLELILKTS